MKKFLFTSMLISLGFYPVAQELNCFVKVNAKQIQGTQTRVFETLEQAIYNFMNQTRWTNDVFLPEERINCSIYITIDEKPSSSEYRGSIQVTSTRTAYKSSYTATMFNHLDQDFDFNYIEYSPLDFNINQYLSNLTSVLAFYAYLIIGIDYNSYELRGGAKYLEQAQKVVNNAQSSQSEGWKGSESTKNRYWLSQNLNDDFYAPLIECIYKYHRLGLDIMYKDTDAGRKVISEALSGLEKIHEARPSSFIMKVFFNAKGDEVVNIFSEATAPEKNQMSRLLTTLDPGGAAKYDKITRN